MQRQAAEAGERVEAANAALVQEQIERERAKEAVTLLQGHVATLDALASKGQEVREVTSSAPILESQPIKICSLWRSVRLC